MKLIFCEGFETRNGDIPSGWFVEKNSDLDIDAIEYSDRSLSLLSAGNKFIPVIPDISDFELKMTVGINFHTAGRFGIIISFRYDIKSGKGQAVRISRKQNSKQTCVEYGSMFRNVFTTEKSSMLEIPDAVLCKAFDISVNADKDSLIVKAVGCSCEFSIDGTAKGKIAISREHFFDLVGISAFEIYSPDKIIPKSENKFTIPMPKEPSIYPMSCEVQLRDFGSCMDIKMTFSGGISDTLVGEGNYHGRRYELLKNPFLKVISADNTEKHVFHEGEILLVKEELVPAYYWGNLEKKVEWPFSASVRFMKPEKEFDLAAGFESYELSTMPDLAQSPSETVFDLSGQVLYSGLGISEGREKIEFCSQAGKEIIKLLPKSDPRYSMAVEFARNNHYFLENENIEFLIKLTSSNELPVKFKLSLENAFFKPLKEIDFDTIITEKRTGVKTYNELLLQVREMPALVPGVYHLRLISDDASLDEINNYIAFEVISRNPDSPAPPQLSGIPFLYNSRTETRGLKTDAFDPWTSSSVDAGHYIACANFLPQAARDFQIAPTVHTYQRKWFLWLGTRCCDKPLIKDNEDLIAEADYINISEEMQRTTALWKFSCKGWRLQKLIEFAKQTRDSGFNIPELEKAKAVYDKTPDKFNSEEISEILGRNYSLTARKYWEEWLDFLNKEFKNRADEFLDKLRSINPKIKFSEYGPAHIYAAHLKGPEYPRYLLCEKCDTDKYGFFQYEDYPYTCSYGLERGTYFLTSCLMAMPGHRIYPEIYTTSSKAFGCPDGAVFFAHPPYGIRTNCDSRFMTRRVYDYALASAYFTPDGFKYWNKCGFQTCGFTRPWFEALLKGWRHVLDYPPARPLKSSAFVSSSESRRAHETFVRAAEGTNIPVEKAHIMDVRNTASEVVPFAYQTARANSISAGFQLFIENIQQLDPEQVDLLVLPPLEGVDAKYINAIRELHKCGVNLLCFESANGLEDIFGIRDSGQVRSVSKITTDKSFLDIPAEYCHEPLCQGRYEANGSAILLNAEIPVLTLKDNGIAKAAFFNVPPQLIKEDQLHERLGYGRESISKLAEAALTEIMKELSGSAFKVSSGRLIAYESRNGKEVVIITNPDEAKDLICRLTCTNSEEKHELLSCDQPYTLLETSSAESIYRLKLPPGECAILVFEQTE